MAMVQICETVHPTWGRIMELHSVCIINDEPLLCSISAMLQLDEDQSKNVIQVPGMAIQHHILRTLWAWSSSDFEARRSQDDQSILMARLARANSY